MPSITKVYVMIQRFIKDSEGRTGELNGMLTSLSPDSVTETSTVG